ncbi:MAG: hypothetical protein WCT02_03665 [Candidatus Paceibacterota bacterium]
MLEPLPTEIPDRDGRKDIISEVAEETLAGITPPEVEPFDISFTNYKEDKCRVDEMDANNARIALRIVRNIGVGFKSHNYFASHYGGSRLVIKPVYNAAPYDDYYKKLPSEIQDLQEVKEIKYVDSRKGKEADLRIFYYTLSNIFYMLAITANAHENLDHSSYQNKKNRR